ncbi:MAG: helix-turn-helix domain-containing protein [Paracoccaceae bacterium]
MYGEATVQSADVEEAAVEAEAESFDWSEDVSTFGDRLARAREFSGMTQAQLARRLGVKTTTIANWEYDRSEPRANRLQMLSGLLNVSIVWLMSGEGDGAPEPEDTAEADAADRAGLRNLLNELRELRVAQDQLADRTGRIEKRLRAMLSAG